MTRPTQVSQCQTQSSCAGTADEARTTIAYTGGNLLVASVSTGAGNGSITATSTMTYDHVGNLLTVDGPLPGSSDTTRFRYDATRRRIGAVLPDPDGGGALKHRAQRITYNTPGFVTQMESGTVNSQSDGDWAAFASLEQLNIAYDADGRPVRRTLTAGGTTHAVQDMSYVNRNYTANGLNQYTARGSITPTYDSRGNLTSAGGATYAYSSENMLTSASGGVTLSYDPMLRLYQTSGSATTRPIAKESQWA